MPDGWRDALEALRRPLEFVARDGFRNLDVVRDLGVSLGSAAARLAPHLPAARQQRFAAWARDVASWESLAREERERLIAVGLRLCAVAATDAPPPPPSTEAIAARARERA